jgi:hypothetical protein
MSYILLFYRDTDPNFKLLNKSQVEKQWRHVLLHDGLALLDLYSQRRLTPLAGWSRVR